jgi:hypothetical protein
MIKVNIVFIFISFKKIEAIKFGEITLFSFQSKQNFPSELYCFYSSHNNGMANVATNCS